MKPFLSLLLFSFPMLALGQSFIANDWQPTEKAYYQTTTGKSNNKTNTQTYIGAGINYNFSSFSDIIEEGRQIFPNLSPKLDYGIKWLKNNISPNLVFKADVSIILFNPRFNIYFDPRLIDPYDPPLLSGPYPVLDARIIFKQVTVALNPTIDYNFINKSNYQMFVGVAASFNLIKNFDFTYYDLQNDKNNQNATYNSPDIYKFKNFLLNYSLQSGITLNKKIELSVTYSPTTTLNNYTVKIENQFIGIGANYLFNK